MSVSFAATALCGLAVLAAFIGWGGAIEQRLFATRTADAGLRGAWGMAFALFAMSSLSLFSLASRPAIFTFVAVGVVLACTRLPRLPTVKQWGGPVFASLALLCFAAAFLQYLGAICDTHFNLSDDFIAYFAFAKQIVQTGTLYDPFSTRLAMAFGGQSFLHAIVLAGAPAFRLHMLDAGICVLMTMLLVAGSRKDGEPAWPAVLALLVVVTLPPIKINTHAEFSGVVLFFGLYRTIAWLEESIDRRAVASAALLSLLGGAACSLRANYLAAAIPMLAVTYAYRIWSSGSDRRAHLREAAVAAAFGLLFLVPWMILSFRSSGTPLFPLIRGHFNEAFPMLQKPANIRQELADIRGTLTQNSFLPAFFLFAFAACLVPDTGRRKPLRSLLIATAIGWVLLISALASDIPSFLRYVFGFLVALVLAGITRCASPARNPIARLGTAAAVIAVIAQLFLTMPHAIQVHTWIIDGLESGAAAIRLRGPEGSPLWRDYNALQTKVPPGKPLLVMVDFPFMFDFSRNEIFNVDTAAAISPPPGFPYFQGPQSVASYLQHAGVRYLAFVRPERALALYRRDAWQKELRQPSAPLWRAQAPVYLDIFANFERLAVSYPKVYDDGALVLLDLAKPATSAAASRPRP